MKHAYLIIAHNEPYILKCLVELLDDLRNDIFIHIDTKSDISQFKDIKTKYSGLYFTKRINVVWGGCSQIKCEYILFETAIQKGEYRYYHLLSGVDLPLKSQDYIHDFFDSIDGKELIGFAKNAEVDIDMKMHYYHFFESRHTSNNRVKARILKSLYEWSMNIQQRLNIRTRTNIEFKKGANWVSITNDLVRDLLSAKNSILRLYRYSFCPDEIFIQTYVWNSKYRDHIYQSSGYEFESCLREIDWSTGYVHKWCIEDWDRLKNSNKLFARKFSSDDLDIVEKVKTSIING